jgi:putative FmdB family regulatory protein
MPLYEYECTQCKRHTEKIQKFSDPEITACPFCGGLLERVITAPAISFKGGGWFKDGYGNAKPASSSEGKGSSDSKSDSGDSAGKSSSDAPAASKDSSPASPSNSSTPPAASALAAPAPASKPA